MKMKTPKEKRTHYAILTSLQNEIRKRGLFHVVRGDLMNIEKLEQAIAADDEMLKVKEGGQ